MFQQKITVVGFQQDMVVSRADGEVYKVFGQQSSIPIALIRKNKGKRVVLIKGWMRNFGVQSMF